MSAARSKDVIRDAGRALLVRWGIAWRRDNDPGIGYPRVTTLKKLQRRARDDLRGERVPDPVPDIDEDWQLLETDAAVRYLMQQSPEKGLLVRHVYGEGLALKMMPELTGWSHSQCDRLLREAEAFVAGRVL